MRFMAGFIVASLLWAVAGYLYLNGAFDAYLGTEEAAEVAEAAEAEEADDRPKKRRKRKKGKRRRKRRAGGGEQAEVDRSMVSTGDDLDWDGDRAVDMNAGEEQLSGPEIESGFDSVMGRIRRCLMLVPGDAEVTGTLRFGMRVAGNGRAKAVNLSGPAYVTKGESGTCLRKAARSIRFATFDGPDMVFKYPIDLE